MLHDATPHIHGDHGASLLNSGGHLHPNRAHHSHGHKDEPVEEEPLSLIFNWLVDEHSHLPHTHQTDAIYLEEFKIFKPIKPHFTLWPAQWVFEFNQLAIGDRLLGIFPQINPTDPDFSTQPLRGPPHWV